MKTLRDGLIAFGGLAWCTAAILGASVAPVWAAPFSTEQTTEIGKIVKDYLLQNPEVLRDAMTELDEREKTAEADTRRKALADMAGPLVNAPDGFVIGNPNGKVTLVEFFDYNCGYCKRALADLDHLMKDNKDLKVILRDFPILSPASVEAALVAVAAHQGCRQAAGPGGDPGFGRFRQVPQPHRHAVLRRQRRCAGRRGWLRRDQPEARQRPQVRQGDVLVSRPLPRRPDPRRPMLAINVRTAPTP